MRYYQFHIGDYTSHTRGLTLIEDLAYRRLIDEYYLSEQPLRGTALEVSRNIGMHEHTEQVEYVLNKFFAPAEGAWRHERIEADIAAMNDKAAKASAAGRVSAARRSGRSTDVEQSLSVRSTDVQPPITHNPTPNNPPTPRASRPSGVDLGLFDAFWQAYPRKVAKPEALKAWTKLKPDAELAEKIMAGLESAKKSRDWTKDDGQYIPHPSTWLNQHRWEDQLDGPGAGADDHFGGLL